MSAEREDRSSPREPVLVTRSFLPPEEEYLFWLRKAFASRILTNNGPIHRELESTLQARFKVPFLRLMSNGTLAIQLALRALGVKGKVITTPFSYVATTSAILWEGCEPVFVDVRPDTLCIDPALIEAAITPDTTAILATHVYGIPCDVHAIDRIARKHGLKVIYDGAHAFDVDLDGRSVLAYGDACTLSFHATKLFHTVEGGATILHDEENDKQLRFLRSFGHIGDDHFTLGMNAKMSEVHAAMGMAVMPHMDGIIAGRRTICERYDSGLADLPLQRPTIPVGTRYNHSYYPVLFADAIIRERVMSALAEVGIMTRRYFYPSLDTLPYVKGAACPVSRDAADRVICLPLYPDLDPRDVDRAVACITAVLADAQVGVPGS
ncbi:MAG: DegT/DnrJ/EryC1/StrS family aminotransferase [Flavobacteriales bacterium]|nr:DegT/DnrJ/EryC1/StrS family aminotransferase [Flavobacteriales bacterium]HRH70944.1 DegT/DnrJ/EryC1/StrS family aminotransferase [Flavobacteriales bacterium]